MRWKLEDTPEQAKFRAEFVDWLKKQLPEGWIEAIEAGDDEAFSKARRGWDFMRWSKTIGDSGYGAPLWPNEYGGLSGEVWMQQITREELGKHRLPTIGLNILGVGLAGPTLIAHGNEEQKKRYLKKIITSEEIWCQLFSEPGSGSDLASVSTRAEKDGDEWVVNGQKVWTSIAQASHYGMLLARTNPDVPKHEGLTYFIVDMKSEGVEVRPLRQMTGSAEFNEVYFTGVRIPDENRVGQIGEGWTVSRTTLMNERVALSGFAVGGEGGSRRGGGDAFGGGTSARSPWDRFLDGLTDRKDTRLRQNVAQIYIEQETKEITSFRASLARRTGQPGPEGGVSKVFNAELNQRRTAFAMNAAGVGAIAWAPGDRAAEARATAFLRARGNTIEGGTSEVLRNQMGERILGLARDVDADRGVPWKDVKRS
ncbi:MAG: acyl-CoA dehydrogenase family protein [Acidimicrobiia bacterium]